MIKIIFLPPAQKYLKKLKDTKLKALYKAEADKLLTDPYAGEAKTSTERFDFFKTAAEMEKKLVERFF